MILCNIPPSLVRLLLHWYKSQILCIKQGSHFSDFFGVSNGVRQGAVLTSSLLKLYINDLSTNLNATMGYSKSNAPNFIIYKQISVATCIIHQVEGTNVRIAFLLLHTVYTSLKSYSPPINEGMYTSVVELSRLMSKPIQDSSFHVIVIAIPIAQEPFFLWTKEVVVWWCQIRRKWRMWYHSPSK